MTTLENLAKDVAEIRQGVQDIDKRVGNLEQDRDSGEVAVTAVAGRLDFVAGGVEGSPPPGVSLPEWISGISGSPGIVVDAGKARATPCIRMELGEGDPPLVYSPGIIGPLDEEQQALYCQEGYEDRSLSEAHQERLRAMSEAARECSVEAREVAPTEQIEAYFGCMGRELKAGGHDTW